SHFHVAALHQRAAALRLAQTLAQSHILAKHQALDLAAVTVEQLAEGRHQGPGVEALESLHSCCIGLEIGLQLAEHSIAVHGVELQLVVLCVVGESLGYRERTHRFSGELRSRAWTPPAISFCCSRMYCA